MWGFDVLAYGLFCSLSGFACGWLARGIWITRIKGKSE